MSLVAFSFVSPIRAADVLAVVDDLDVGRAAVLGQRVERKQVNSGFGRPENSGSRIESVSGIHIGPVECHVTLKQKRIQQFCTILWNKMWPNSDH